VLAEVLGRDGQQLSASQTRQQALADADHLAVLHAIWDGETTTAREQRYQQLLTDALPVGYRQEPSRRAKWLWRTLRAAELAGLDARQVLTDAIGERNLTGARDVHAVIDARIRRRTGALVPRQAGPWCARLPEIADADRRAYTMEIAALMDARKQRIGEHAATSTLPWAVTALGPVPGDPVTRVEWQRRADPIGPEPATGSPDLRAAWQEALAALGRADGPDVRGMPDGLLLHLRDTYPVETVWAPLWTGDELRQVRGAARDARLGALRAAAEAIAAKTRDEHEEAAWQQELAASYQAMHDIYRQHENVLAVTMEDRAEWEQATRHQRHLAVAADTELRRRHPGQPWPPLRSAEPELNPETEPVAQAQDGTQPLTPGTDIEQLAQQISELAARHHEFADRLANRQSLMIPAADPDYQDLGPAFPAWAEPRRGAILQPPKPHIPPSERILDLTADRDRDLEAAD